LDTNFVVCSVGTIAAEGSVTVIPFTNTYAGDTEGLWGELSIISTNNWDWKVMLLIGADRNMFGVGHYP
jgi:hypothetical protein